MLAKQDRTDLAAAFHSDIDEMCGKLIETYDLKYEQTGDAGLHEPLLRWMDFRLRYIDPQPRKFVVSKKFPLSLPDDIGRALANIEKLIMTGGDLNPYQSATLTKFNDTSGVKRQKRTDGLWADWGVHHLHLSDEPVTAGEAYSKRSDWLLFCAIFPDAIAFIDVRRHGEDEIFQQRHLVETLLTSWPEYAEQYRLKGALGLANKTVPTPTDTAALRRAGVANLIELNGKVYAPPGMGVTTAATATRVSYARNDVRRWTSEIAKLVNDPEGQYQKKAKEAGIIEPQFAISVLPDGDLAIHETTCPMAWRLPRLNAKNPKDLFCALHNLILPQWAGGSLYRHWTANP